MGGFSFAPRRRSYSTFWQIVLRIIFRKLLKIFTLDLIDTQVVTINLINTEIIEIEVENC